MDGRAPLLLVFFYIALVLVRRWRARTSRRRTDHAPGAPPPRGRPRLPWRRWMIVPLVVILLHLATRTMAAPSDGPVAPAVVAQPPPPRAPPPFRRSPRLAEVEEQRRQADARALEQHRQAAAEEALARVRREQEAEARPPAPPNARGAPPAEPPREPAPPARVPPAPRPPARALGGGEVDLVSIMAVNVAGLDRTTAATATSPATNMCRSVEAYLWGAKPRPPDLACFTETRLSHSKASLCRALHGVQGARIQCARPQDSEPRRGAPTFARWQDSASPPHHSRRTSEGPSSAASPG